MALSWEDLFGIIRQRFADTIENVPTAGSVYVIYDNQAKTPPKQDGAESLGWCRLWLTQTSDTRIELGPEGHGIARFRKHGVMIVQIFSPIAASGDISSRQRLDQLTTAFRDKFVDGVSYGGFALKTVGRSGKWWQVNVTCPFHADDIR